MSDVIRQTLDLLGCLGCPAIYVGDFGDEHVVSGFARLSWHVYRPC
jgi:hypothetical protein